ncbi:hypothetical protein RRG08_065047 [Elysia crispata]|uniref:Uncharacterized protein n=1 Tax=Elysia crispata TaxID=231223 RepID=A0AAE0ZKW4_9GAST|nr:hypothetical protein RRG08_065047 [Elysia crispata]
MVITVGTVFVPSQMTNNLSRWHGHHSRDSICPQSDDKQSIKMAWLFTIESIFLPGPKAKKLPRFHDHHGRVCSPPQHIKLWKSPSGAAPPRPPHVQSPSDQPLAGGPARVPAASSPQRNWFISSASRRPKLNTLHGLSRQNAALMAEVGCYQPCLWVSINGWSQSGQSIWDGSLGLLARFRLEEEARYFVTGVFQSNKLKSKRQ